MHQLDNMLYYIELDAAVRSILGPGHRIVPLWIVASRISATQCVFLTLHHYLLLIQSLLARQTVGLADTLSRSRLYSLR